MREINVHMSPTITSLAPALIKAKAAFHKPKKDRVNPFFKSRYADLDSCLDACNQSLMENGLTVCQWPGECSNGCLALTTMIMHSSGEWMAAEAQIPIQKPEPQAFGSALTYARRYGLCAALGLSPDDDDDGHATLQPQQQQANGTANNRKITDAQARELEQLAIAKGVPIDKLAARFGGTRLTDLTFEHYQFATANLRKMQDRSSEAVV